MKPRVYCDFNDRLDRTSYGLRVLGTLADLERQQLALTGGLPLILYDQDGFPDGGPAWIVVDAVVVPDADLGFIAQVDPETFRWVPRRGDPHADLQNLARFRVAKVFELPGRGGVAAGSILQGEMRGGQRTIIVDSQGVMGSLEISSVEAMDDLPTGQSWVALLFVGSPTEARLRQVASEGSVLDFA